MSTGNDPVERSEYEAFIHTYEVRHAELRLELKESEVELKTQMSSMINKMDNLAAQVNRRSLDAFKIIATASISLIVGYIGGLLQHLFLR